MKAGQAQGQGCGWMGLGWDALVGRRVCLRGGEKGRGARLWGPGVLASTTFSEPQAELVRLLLQESTGPGASLWLPSI